MKYLKFIIGLSLYLTFVSGTHAAYCDTSAKSLYKDTYCNLKPFDSTLGQEALNEDALKAVAIQIAYDPKNPESDGENADTGLVKLILEDQEHVCSNVKKYMEDENVEEKDFPTEIKNACFLKENEIGNLNLIITKAKNAYQKEKVLQQTKDNLKYELEASEKWWDGTLTNSTFDLIVDLNLIETVLFGKKAVWTNDVWAFPKKDEKDKGDSTAENEPEDISGEEGPKEGSGQSIVPPKIPTAGKTTKPDCVSANDPDADTGSGPGSRFSNQKCGDGTVDQNLAEECDDGNDVSGDGCSQYCKNETAGSDLMCQDQEAVTFKTAGSSSTSKSYDNSLANSGTQDEAACPPGTFPRKSATVTNSSGTGTKDAPQSATYPGPFVGGTLKEFPEVVAPPCPAGQSEFSFSARGSTEKTCIPTELCADINDARDFIAKKLMKISDWRSLPADDANRQALESFEFLFCVNITTANRPLSPYTLNDGCVDCHITQMVDSLEKALQGNVSPLENTMSAFGISSRWGPKFSFDLNTSVKSRFKLLGISDKKPATAGPKKAQEETEHNNPTGGTTLDFQESASDKLNRVLQGEEIRNAAVDETLKDYRVSGSNISDQAMISRVLPLFEQMRASFENMQSDIAGIVGTVNLDNKDQCTF